MLTDNDNSTADNSELLTARQAAAVLHVAPGTLAIWRCRKRYSLSYTKVGSKVLYRRGDLEAFLNAGIVAPVPRKR